MSPADPGLQTDESTSIPADSPIPPLSSCNIQVFRKGGRAKYPFLSDIFFHSLNFYRLIFILIKSFMPNFVLKIEKTKK
jgi:hypothetical protein